jgi:DNA-directed RNA polymerase specialized sigma24 family protein
MTTQRKRPESWFLRTLYGPLLDDARREVEEALKVALLLHHEVPAAEIADRLGISLGEVKGAAKRVARARARERLERERPE